MIPSSVSLGFFITGIVSLFILIALIASIVIIATIAYLKLDTAAVNKLTEYLNDIVHPETHSPSPRSLKLCTQEKSSLGGVIVYISDTDTIPEAIQAEGTSTEKTGTLMYAGTGSLAGILWPLQKKHSKNALLSSNEVTLYRWNPAKKQYMIRNISNFSLCDLKTQSVQDYHNYLNQIRDDIIWFDKALKFVEADPEILSYSMNSVDNASVHYHLLAGMRIISENISVIAKSMEKLTQMSNNDISEKVTDNEMSTLWKKASQLWQKHCESYRTMTHLPSVVFPYGHDMKISESSPIPHDGDDALREEKQYMKDQHGSVRFTFAITTPDMKGYKASKDFHVGDILIPLQDSTITYTEKERRQDTQKYFSDAPSLEFKATSQQSGIEQNLNQQQM